MVNTHARPTSWVCGLLQSHRPCNWDLKLLNHGLGILNHNLIILSLNVCFKSEVQRDDEASTRDSEIQHTRGPTPCHHPAMRLRPPAFSRPWAARSRSTVTPHPRCWGIRLSLEGWCRASAPGRPRRGAAVTS